MDETITRAQQSIEPDELMVRGIALMVAIKLVAIKWIGLDADAWYVWPWTWVAFAMMAPAIVEWVNECRGDWSS